MPSGGIFAITGGENDANNIPTTESCINYGCIRAGKLYCGGGIMGSDSENTENAGDGSIIIRNCANYGEILSGKIRGGISGSLSSLSNIFSCFNAGQVASATTSGGIVGTVFDTAHISNCLDVSGMHIMIDKWEVTGDSISNMSSNYYDRQMSGGSGEDIEGETEGRLTSQLTGDTPELRAMLGDGWSYAEGRYPIPLGLETDSLAMLFATPIYLYAENADNYDDVDLVQHHFTVGTENGVSWASGSRLNIVGENATILASGSENITANLAGYSFTRNLNLINPVIVDEHIFDDVKIFPNPATDILNITSSETISEIEIVNTLGQVVKRIEVNSDNAVCDVDDLRSGVYVVRIHVASTTLSLRRFVKE
ncbi:MAG: T9SS type A sorting domain-containing protein [Bacteroidales bacterium]|nr:T9SS type A sorting domain-containing protein [Bacteroidales bacterium]